MIGKASSFCDSSRRRRRTHCLDAGNELLRGRASSAVISTDAQARTVARRAMSRCRLRRKSGSSTQPARASPQLRPSTARSNDHRAQPDRDDRLRRSSSTRAHRRSQPRPRGACRAPSGTQVRSRIATRSATGSLETAPPALLSFPAEYAFRHLGRHVLACTRFAQTLQPGNRISHIGPPGRRFRHAPGRYPLGRAAIAFSKRTPEQAVTVQHRPLADPVVALRSSARSHQRHAHRPLAPIDLVARGNRQLEYVALEAG